MAVRASHRCTCARRVGGAARCGQPRQQALADLAHPLGVAGLDEHLAERLVDLDGQLPVVADQPSGPLQVRLGAGQRAATERPSPRLEVQPGRPGRFLSLFGELGRQLAPLPGQARMSGLDSTETARGEGCSLRRKELREDGVPSQRMAEPEAGPGIGGLHGQQLGVDSPAEAIDHSGFVLAAHVRQQAPVEASAEQRRRHEKVPGARACSETSPNGLGERGGDGQPR